MRGIVILVISFMSPFKIVRKLGEVFFEGDIEPPSGDAALAADACNAAADHFDDPAVAEEMDRLLEENPDNLDEIVENDETLRNLRDSDPIAAELMRDPETFKVITDGENLRAMGELTEAMQADFANGLDGGGGGVDAAANAMDALNTADAVGDAADAADAAGDAGDAFETTDYEEPELEEEEEEEEEEGGAADDAEEYLQDAELEDDDMKKTGRKGQRGKGKNQRNRGGQAAQGAKGILGAGISAVAGGFLGDAMGDMMDFGGGEDLAGVAGEDMGGLEDVAADAVSDQSFALFVSPKFSVLIVCISSLSLSLSLSPCSFSNRNSSMQQMSPKPPRMPARVVSPPKNLWSWVPLVERLWPPVLLGEPTPCHEMAKRRTAKRAAKAKQTVNKTAMPVMRRTKMKRTRRKKECSANSRVALEILPHLSPILPRKPSSRLSSVMTWVTRCSRQRTASRRPKKSLQATVKRRATTIPVETMQRTVEAVSSSDKVVNVAPTVSATKEMIGMTMTIGTTIDRKSGDEGYDRLYNSLYF